MRSSIFAAALVFFAAAFLADAPMAAGAAPESLQLTIYNQDLGMVKEVRTLELEQGINEVRLEAVAAARDLAIL